MAWWCTHQKDLCVYLDNTLAVHRHICYLCCSLFLAPNHFNWYLTESTTAQLISSFSTSGLDYGNSNFAGLPETEVIIYKGSKQCSHVSCEKIKKRTAPVLALTAFSVQVDYKVATLAFPHFDDLLPPYLSSSTSPLAPWDTVRRSHWKFLGKISKEDMVILLSVISPPLSGTHFCLQSPSCQLASPASFKTNLITHPSVKPFHHSH